MENTIKLLCILGPLLFLADLVLRMALGKGSAAQRWHTLWTEEHWLVCDWLGGLRQALSTPLFLALLVILWGWGTVEEVCELFFAPHLLTVLTAAKALALSGLILAKLLCCTRYSYRQLLWGAAVFGMLAASYSVHGYLRVMQAVFLLLAAKDTSLRADLWTILVTGLLSFGTKVGLAMAGYLDKMATSDGGRVRYALGYGSYNALGITVAELLLVYFLLRYKRLRWWDWLPLAGGLAFIHLVPNSRGSLGLCLLVFLIGAAAKYLPRLAEKKWVPRAMGVLAVFPALFSAGWIGYFFLLLRIRPPEHLLGLLFMEKLFSGRVRLAGAYVNSYGGPHLWGQEFTTQRGLLYSVDNAYVYYFYLMGPIVALILLAGSVWLVLRLVRRGGADWALAAVVVGFLFYGVMERNFSVNLFTLLLCNVAFADSYSLTLNETAKPARNAKEVKG